MKKLFFSLSALALIAAGCTDKPKQPTENPEPETEIEIDTLVADWDESNAPMPIYGISEYDEATDCMVAKGMRHIYDYADSALYAPVKQNYHTLVYNGNKQGKIRFTGEQKGQTTGYLISGPYAWCMKGLNYELVDGGSAEGIAFTDAFLQNHQIVPVIQSDKPSPKAINDSVEARYNQKVLKGYTCATSEDGTLGIYSIQMKPQGNKCLGMRVISDNGQLHILEEPTENYGEYSAWHVDDGDEYYPFSPIVVTRGPKGLDIFYVETAPESYTYSALLVRQDSITNYCFSQYYCAVDFEPAPDPVALPDGSVLKDESEEGYKVWVHTDVAPTEDDPAGVYSVYYLNPEDKQIYKVVTTGQNPNAMEKFNFDQPYVSEEDVQTAQEVFIIQKPGCSYCELIMQGCPDCRNTMTYVVTLPIHTISPMFKWIRTNEGYQGKDESGELLKFHNYGYHEEGGRYTMCQYYDLDFNLVKEEMVEDAE